MLEKIPQTIAAARVAKLAKGFGLDLANALSCHGEVLAHLFERVLTAILQTKSHFHDFFFTGTQRFQDLGRLLAQIEIDHGFRGRNHPAVYQEIAQVRFFLFADGSLK